MIKGNKKEPCDFNTRLMYQEALSFEETARRLGDWLVEGKQPEGLLGIPWMINMAFAIELYLKILLVVEKNYKAINEEKHNLLGLFNGLRLETRNALHQKGVFGEELLGIFSDAFVACRYCYEYSGFIIDGIPTFIELSKALRIIVGETLIKESLNDKL